MTITLLAPDGVPVTAKQERQARAAAHGGGAGRQLGGRSGWRVGTPDNVLTATSTTWTLGPCAAMIDPLASTHQGMYGWSSDANITGTVDAADATYARKDIVYIRVNDSSAGDGSGALNANVYYLAGNPTATPEVPTVPQRGFLVGTISVPAAGGGSPTVTLNPARYVAAGGILPVDSTQQAALTQSPGLATSRDGILEISDGTSWVRPGAKTIPTPASFAGPAIPGTAFTTGTYTPIIQAGTVVVTTDAQGYFTVTYPNPFPSGVLTFLPGSGDASVGRNVVVAAAGTPFTQSLTTGYGSAVTGSNVPFSSATLRVNYIAVGF